MDWSIRDALASDAGGVLDIYAPHITGGGVTFETAVPPIEEMRGRIIHTKGEYPYLVAEDSSGILGYAYAGRVRSRDAYQWSAELSVYIRKDAKGRGIGRALVNRVVTALTAMGVRTLYAVITYPNPESVGFHARIGFKQLCIFKNMGYKLDRWWDVIWMELSIGAYDIPPKPITPYPLLLHDSLV